MDTPKTRSWTSIDATPDFQRLGERDLSAMVEAGHEVRNCIRVLAKTGDNLVGEILRLSDNFYEWDHYPQGDVIDAETHSQFYYHAHVEEERGPDEHGHFHTFLRAKGMPPGLAPVPESRLLAAGGKSGAAVSASRSRAVAENRPCHLVAIAMDAAGLPIRLFTTNRWVTGDDWYRADDVKAMLDRYMVDIVHPSWAVNRWIGAMLRLFRPQILALLDARDRTIVAWQRRHGDNHDVFEDRALDVTSCIDIDIEKQIAVAERALEQIRGRRDGQAIAH